ncbi:GNAT family N-acetyltransferase [Alkalihalobacterium bogoriense]|uniref:GNAT family N-acetyltransferase n=1 Tax=Alkalihalobacterium bogoriense TaxID=246272 RepID=UPI00047B3CEE|nr:GNAT family N-acetyltransferase [Alkalihalobacterium bogoriense]
MESVIVRKAKKEDQQQLLALMNEYIVDFYNCPKPAGEKLERLVLQLLEREIGFQFIAEVNGNLVGFATLYFSFSTTKAEQIVVMNDLYVIEPWRGKGVAKLLFEACFAYKVNNGFATMMWETAETNKRAQRFYEKMGGKKGDWIMYSI